jgi:adenylate cyclase
MNNQTKKRIRRSLIGVSILIGLTLSWEQFAFTRQLEQHALDLRHRSFNRDKSASDRVVVIDINDQSLRLLAAHYGRWPWPRRVYQKVIEFISLGEPAGIFFDILFTEPQEGEDDISLALTSQAVGNVSHAMMFLVDSATIEEEPRPLPEDFQDRFGTRLNESPLPWLFHNQALYQDYILPASTYMDFIPRIHSVNFDNDPDGQYRRASLGFQYQGNIVPSLTLSGLLSTLPGRGSIQTEKSSLKVLSEEGTLAYHIPLRPDGRYPIHFYRPEKGPLSIPIAAIIQASEQIERGEIVDFSELLVHPMEFTDKIVIFGASAAGLEDLKATPVHQSLPGVLLHASAISNILDKDFLKFMPVAWQTIIGVLLTLLIYLSMFFTSALWSRIGIPVLLLGSYGLLSIWLFQNYSIVLALAMPLTVGGIALFDGLAYISFTEGRDKKRLTGTLSKYLSPTVTQRMIESGNDPRAEVGKSEVLSVLFSDIRGFTSLSEQLPPDQLVERLNEYLGRMTDVIFLENGTLDKFIGDAIMAFWGAPLPNPDHALHATRCALAMKNALKVLSKEWAERGIPPIEIGVGINTGEVIVGNIGSEKRLDYTVIGDNVNLASRIEGLTKQYGVQLLVGEQTEELIGNKILCRPIDLVQVKGKEKHVKIGEPLGEIGGADEKLNREIVDRFSDAWNLYLKGDFKTALTQFETLQTWMKAEDGPTRLYLERCQNLIQNPPKEWNGVFIATSK